MSETSTSQSNSTPANPTSTPSGEGSASQNPGLNMPQVVSMCAGGLFISFFLPWATIMGGNISGFELQKLGEYHKLLWLIPVCSVITIAGGVTGKGQRLAAQVTGALPYFTLIYWFYQLGKDLTEIMTVGAYLSLGLGLVMFILARRLK